jgi:hypothetical protein
MSNLMMTIYNSHNVEVDNFSSGTSVFVVYFSESGGRIVFKATAPITLVYFSMKSLWQCWNYFVNSSLRERWGSGDNFTIGNSQDICLFYISKNVATVSGEYDTQIDFDVLNYEYSDARTSSYTGSGSFSAVSNYYTAFRWHSNLVTPSVSISVQLSSPSSLLSSRSSVGAGTSSEPIILMDDEPGGAAFGEPGRGMSKWAVAGIAASGLVAVALVAAAVVKLARRKWSRGPLREPLELESGSSSYEFTHGPPPSRLV